MIRFFTILFFLFSLSREGYAGNCDSNDFKSLVRLTKKKTITEQEWKDAYMVIKRLDKNRCADYELKNGNKIYVVSSLTYLFGEICCRYDNIEGVRSYMHYLEDKEGSAEEELSFSFEKLFVRKPEWVLTEMDKSSNKYECLSHLVWGFINNRYYGAKDPFLNKPNKAFTHYDTEPKPLLTVKNYKEIFWTVNPGLKKMYKEYQELIDALFIQIEKELKSHE